MIKQPDLLTYENPEYFSVRNGAVLFTAPCGGATTKHSNYPRCELRETIRDSAKLASWSTAVGSHILMLQGATLALPPVKPQVVLAQIHDPSDDLLEVMADGLASKGKVVIAVRWQGVKSTRYLDSDYVLGTPYHLKMIATGGRMSVEYSCGATSNSSSSPLEQSGCYFKAGCYTQSNPSKGDSPSAIGQTMLTAVAVTHIV
jgi:poly(beta-D-mannuronate) lyase